MIKTKISLTVFSFLTIIQFPFSILFLNSDFVSSVIPGWNTTIVSPHLIATIFKSILMLIVITFYWKLNKVVKEIDLKFFILHLILTIPSIINSKIPLHSLIEFDNDNFEKAIKEYEFVDSIVITLNILFVIGQIIFGVYYTKKMRQLKVGE
ncbi:hypothetical protein [Flavobacterium cyanobacteriorum]|nr:hypothetical protein [Flavobacterium cyanobacteriorum]